MSGWIASTSEVPGPGVLERARGRARLSVRELWIRYMGLGGSRTPSELDGILSSSDAPDVREYNLVVDALNERLADLGLNAPVRYATA